MVEEMGEYEEGPDLSVLMGLSGEGAPLTDEEVALLAMQAAEALGEERHGDNLAEYLEAQDLARLAQDVIGWVDDDVASRKDWEEREARGIRALGVTTQTDGGAAFPGASRVVHPLLAESVVDVHARLMAELWPNEGPVKAQVLGDATPELQAQAMRVQGFMNYQYAELMPGGFEEHDQLLFRLPVSGSCFKKTYYCPLEQTNVSVFIEPTRVHVPYSATSLKKAARITHEFVETRDDTLKKMAAGFYRRVELGDPVADEDEGSVDSAIDSAQGTSRVDYEDDVHYTRYEMHVSLDLPGFEDPDGIGVPYVVTVDKDSQQVLAVYRNWAEGDERRRRLEYFTHYQFLRGLGFYGFGFYHIVGGLATAATGALRAFLDAALLANMQGGFKSRYARLTGGKKQIEMGAWNEVDASPEELAKAFMPFPNKAPSEALFKILGYLTDIGAKFANRTSQLVAEGNSNAPVGTTLALIEQGLKIFTGVTLRIHRAQHNEFRILARLNKENLPPQYPYRVAGADQTVFAADFDDRVDVVPVSDPNVVSSTQRIAMAQSVLQLVNGDPELYGQAGRRTAHRNMLIAMRVPNLDAILPPEPAPEPPPPRMDPVNENMKLMGAKPVLAYVDQHHEAHIMAHQSFVQALPEGLPKGQKTAIEAACWAHIAEHLGFLYRAQVEAQLGSQIPEQEYPPEIEAQISEAVAMRTQVMLPRLEKPTPQDEIKQATAEETRARIERADLEAAAGIERDNAKATADLQRQAVMAAAAAQQKAEEQVSGLI